jgi:hypothetical protein
MKTVRWCDNAGIIIKPEVLNYVIYYVTQNHYSV